MTRRILFFLSALLVVALIVLAYSFYGLQKSTSNVLAAETRSKQFEELETQLYTSSIELTAAARSFAASSDEKYEKAYNAIADIREGKAEIPKNYSVSFWDNFYLGTNDAWDKTGIKRSLLGQAKDIGMSKKEIAALKKAFTASNTLKALEIQAFNAAKGIYKSESGFYSKLGSPDKEAAQALLYSQEYYEGKTKIMTAIEAFHDAVEDNVVSEESRQQETQSLFRILFAASAAASLLIIVGIAYLINLQNKRDLARRAALQQAVEHENDQLNDSVISLLESVNSLSQRDLTVVAPVTEDVIGTVSDSINAFSSETAKVLMGVTKIAEQVSDVSGNVKRQADQVTLTAEEERKSVQGMVSSLLDATQTMNRVAALAEQSNDSADEASKITNGALVSVNDTVVGMDSIRDTISETEKRIKRLGERSQEISGIVNLINTISERTHVLALNASMQAAVAGEAGRGFAVVAEEVQRLAESSRNATQQIATLVNNIQIETNETINTVNETIGQVVEGSEKAQRAGEQMRLTQQITEQLVSQVQSIAQASDQQKEMSGVLLEAVQRIGDSTEQTEQQIKEQNKETDALLDASAALVDSVSVFTLPSSDSAA